MKIKTYLYLVLSFVLLQSACNVKPTIQTIQFIEKELQVDVMIDDQLFTSYIFHPDLPKPILYPVYSPSGVFMSRHNPPDTAAGESDDHKHHAGIFFTFDDVNDSLPEIEGVSGYWNNKVPEPPYITHYKIQKMSVDKQHGVLTAVLHWIGRDKKVHLEEVRTMTFYPGSMQRTIDFDVTLTAKGRDAVFHDTKEGMFAIRVPVWLTEKSGTGKYLGSDGGEMEKGVWGRRNKWVRLQGENDGKVLGIAILNHPDSVNYPAYYHARAYGLFSANPLGQYDFEKAHNPDNAEKFNLRIKQGESALFKFRMIIYEGARTKDQLDREFKNYAGEN